MVGTSILYASSNEPYVMIVIFWANDDNYMEVLTVMDGVMEPFGV
jgi:hypothetical protein